MINSNNKMIVKVPSFIFRIFSVWLRHYQVYTKTIISNGFPPFLEPLILLAGLGLGLGKFVGVIEGVDYVKFLATGIAVTSAMYTAAFECTFGTFLRLDFDNIYDGMLSASITVKDLLLGEIFFAGTKGLFFSSAVLIVLSFFGLIPSFFAFLAPLVGFLTGLMFGALSLFVTSFVTTINHFNFYFTGFLTPMFFFSGIIFPLNSLPKFAAQIAVFFPLTHSVNLIRALCLNKDNPNLFFDLTYIIIFILIFSFLAVWRLGKRIIN